MQFFLLPINMQEGLSRQIEARVRDIEKQTGEEINPAYPPKTYTSQIREAHVIEIPELHTFVDARGDEYQICALSQEHAEQIAQAQSWIAKPVHWTGSAVPLPGHHIVRTGRQYNSEELGAMGITLTAEQAQDEQ